MNRFILCLLLLISQSSLAQNLHVSFIINTDVGSGLGGNPDYDEYFIWERLSKSFPDSQPISIRPRTNEELIQELLKYNSSDFIVDALVIQSHGMSGVDGPPENKVFTLGIDNENNGFLVMLLDQNQVSSSFGPIIGKFDPHAKIIFHACNLINVGQNFEKLSIMKQVANYFGLKSGSIFMSSQEVKTLTDLALKQPYDQQPDTRRAFANFASQLLWFLTGPIYWINDHYLYNNGYTLKLSNNDGKK